MTTPTVLAAAPPPRHQPPPNARRLPLWAGVAAGPIFAVTALVTGALRDGYDPMRHPISSLSIGEYGWIQIANFILCGALTLGFALGARRALKADGRRSLMGPLFIAIWAVGLIGAGVFVADPIGGYPAGTPETGIHTWHGTLHDFPFSTVGFLSVIAACLVFTWRFAGWRQFGLASYSAFSALLIMAGLVTSNLGFAQTDFADIAGLLQRLMVLAIMAWLTRLAIHLLIRSPAPQDRAGRAGRDQPSD